MDFEQHLSRNPFLALVERQADHDAGPGDSADGAGGLSGAEDGASGRAATHQDEGYASDGSAPFDLADWIVAPDEDYVVANAGHTMPAQVQIPEPAPDVGAGGVTLRRSERQRKQRAAWGVAVTCGPTKAASRKRKGKPKARVLRLEDDNGPSAEAAPEADDATVSTSQAHKKPKARKKKGSKGTKKAAREERKDPKPTAATSQPLQASNGQQLEEDTQPATKEQKKFKCPDCASIFTRLDSAKEHYRSTHLGVVYACTVCDRELMRRRNLVDHMQKLHRGHDVSPPPLPDYAKLDNSMFEVI
ncbi:hypothetical protein DENSPDRAFT_891080 [Dentipellis sp. KUC8613]|nr:hypothetical protein DENSPDRAFT_891080 [Dentipellis sp. KUC8613]